MIWCGSSGRFLERIGCYLHDDGNYNFSHSSRDIPACIKTFFNRPVEISPRCAVGNPRSKVPVVFHHILVIASAIWAFETCSTKRGDQVAALNRTKVRHLRGCLRQMPSITGISAPCRIPRKIQPSRTLRNSLRQASNVSWFA